MAEVETKTSFMVIDDDVALLRLVRRMLEGARPESADIETFTDPVAGKQRLENHGCDVLITDLNMPVHNGFDLLRVARAQSPWIQVICITSHASVAVVAQAAMLGACDFLVKPLDRNEFLDAVGEAEKRAARWRGALSEALKAQWESVV